VTMFVCHVLCSSETDVSKLATLHVDLFTVIRHKHETDYQKLLAKSKGTELLITTVTVTDAKLNIFDN
jgi:hypothetical protein